MNPGVSPYLMSTVLVLPPSTCCQLSFYLLWIEERCIFTGLSVWDQIFKSFSISLKKKKQRGLKQSVTYGWIFQNGRVLTVSCQRSSVLRIQVFTQHECVDRNTCWWSISLTPQNLISIHPFSANSFTMLTASFLFVLWASRRSWSGRSRSRWLCCGSWKNRGWNWSRCCSRPSRKGNTWRLLCKPESSRLSAGSHRRQSRESQQSHPARSLRWALALLLSLCLSERNLNLCVPF